MLKDFIGEILPFVLFGVMFFLPPILIIIDIVFLVKKKEHPIFESIAFFVGTAEMFFAYFIWDLPPYTQPLNIYGIGNAHEPVNLEFMPGILLLSVWGFISYFLLKFRRKEKISPISGERIRKPMPPLTETILLGGIYAGALLCIAFLVQIWCGAYPQPYTATGGEIEESLGSVQLTFDSFDYAIIFCLSVVPFFFLIHCVHLMITIVKEKAQLYQGCSYENPFLKKMNEWLLKGSNLFFMGLVMMLPILGILVMLLLLFGQQPDSVILAFTKTSDWVLSGEISPPPVAYDTHYLCTVSLRGHRKLVRPIRYGMRRGEKIVVNRQLCVANAFEQLLEERTPKFHRAVRTFYDRYGYPVSKHINTAPAADIVYVIMKPLEWIFVIILYLFDEKPENRICSQYLPKK